MKTKFLLIATAALCLAACNKQEIIDGPDDHGKEGDYMIEIAELDQPTKSSPSTVELNLADLVSPSSKNITAQLKKRSGSGWANVDNGVTYSWSATSEDSQKFSGSGTVNQSCNVSAKKAGTGNITVSAAISGTTVATQPVPVKVSDDRTLSWTNATTSLTAGEVKTAVLNSNFSGTASISSNNSSFLVGTSENSLNTTTSVTFGTKKSHTIYYKYTGSSQTTVSLNAKFAGINDAIISIETILDEVKFKGHYTCNFYDDDRGMGYDVPCVEESLYFNAIRGGEIIAEKVQFKVESYNLYGGLNGIYGPYTTMYIDEYDYRYNYGPYDPTDPNNRDYILISFEGTDYRFKYSEMTIERTIL